MFQLPDKVPSLQCFDFQLLLGRPMPPQPPVLSQFEPMSKKIETLGKQSENKSLQNIFFIEFFSEISSFKFNLRKQFTVKFAYNDHPYKESTWGYKMVAVVDMWSLF